MTMKKQIKKTAKTVKKDKKELYVNLYAIKDIDDLYFNFAIGKCNANIPNTSIELVTIYTRGLNDAFEFATSVINLAGCVNSTIDKVAAIVEEKKTPWYKKFWNKITNPFRRNK